MKITQINFNERARAILELPLIYFISFSALSTISLMMGLKFSAKFSTISSWIVVLLFVAGIPLWNRLSDIFKSGNKSSGDRLFVILVLLVSLAGALLASSINRPDIDDSIYVPKAVFYMENPDSELNRSMNWVAGLPKNTSSGIFQHYEITQAALAYKLNIHFLDLYHIVFPAIVGFFLVSNGRQDDFANRSKLFRYLYQHDPNQDKKEGKEVLVKLISSMESPELVVTYDNFSNKEEIENTLLHHGYVKAMEINHNYVVFQRIDSSPRRYTENDRVLFN